MGMFGSNAEYHFYNNSHYIGGIETELFLPDNVLTIPFISVAKKGNGHGTALLEWLINSSKETICPVAIVSDGEPFWSASQRKWPERLDTEWYLKSEVISRWFGKSHRTLYRPLVNILNDQPARFDEEVNTQSVKVIAEYLKESQSFSISTDHCPGSEFHHVLKVLNQQFFQIHEFRQSNGEYFIEIDKDYFNIEFKLYDFTKRPTLTKPADTFYLLSDGTYGLSFFADSVSPKVFQKELDSINTLIDAESEFSQFPVLNLDKSTSGVVADALNDPRSTRSYSIPKALEECSLIPLPYGKNEGMVAIDTPAHWYLWSSCTNNEDKLWQINKSHCTLGSAEEVELGYVVEVDRLKNKINVSSKNQQRYLKIDKKGLNADIDQDYVVSERYHALQSVDIDSKYKYPLPHRLLNKKSAWQGKVVAKNELITVIQDTDKRFFSLDTVTLPALSLGDNITYINGQFTLNSKALENKLNLASHLPAPGRIEVNNYSSRYFGQTYRKFGDEPSRVDHKAIKKMHSIGSGLTPVGRSKGNAGIKERRTTIGKQVDKLVNKSGARVRKL